MNITASLVLYHNNPEDIKNVIDSIVNSVFNDVYNHDCIDDNITINCVASVNREDIDVNSFDNNINNVNINNDSNSDSNSNISNNNIDNSNSKIINNASISSISNINSNSNNKINSNTNIININNNDVGDKNNYIDYYIDNKNNRKINFGGKQDINNQALKVTLYVIDNSSKDDLREICCGENIHYIFNGLNNRGFGAGHNIGIKMAEKMDSDIHLIVNPDVFFDADVLSKIIDFMQKNQHVGLLMPKILFPDGQVQHVCKLIPNPLNYLLRGLGLHEKFSWAKRINDDYEMKFSDYNSTMRVPCVSGCFMVFRTKVFAEIGYFDENIFMYLEDNDISRRVFRKYDVVMYNEAVVYHKWGRAVYNSIDAIKFKKIILRSAKYYFQKWGWFFDQERKDVNTKVKKNWKF